MKKILLFLFMFNMTLLSFSQDYSTYMLNETEAEFNQKIEWLRTSKIGLMFNFGVFSMFKNEYQGFITDDASNLMYQGNIPPSIYENYIKAFNPSFDDIEKFISSISKGGIDYVILPVKKPDGFCMFDSKYTNYDVVEHTAYGKDLTEQIVSLLHKYDIKVGFEYSILDWNHPSQTQYDKDGFKKNVSINSTINEGEKASYIQYMKDQFKELNDKYSPDMIHFNGDWVFWWTAEDAFDMVNYVRSLNSNIIINNQLGRNEFVHGDYQVFDNKIPDEKHIDRDWMIIYDIQYKKDVRTGEFRLRKPDKIIDNMLQALTSGGSFCFRVNPSEKIFLDEKGQALIDHLSSWVNLNKFAIKETVFECGKCLESGKTSWGYYTVGSDQMFAYISKIKKKFKFPKLENETSYQSASVITENGILPLILTNKNGKYIIELPEGLEVQDNSVFIIK